MLLKKSMSNSEEPINSLLGVESSSHNGSIPASLQRILDEDSNELLSTKINGGVISADRRVELDLLLQQADLLARPSGNQEYWMDMLRTNSCNGKEVDRNIPSPAPDNVGGTATWDPDNAAAPATATVPAAASAAAAATAAAIVSATAPIERQGRRWLGGGGLLHVASLDRMTNEISSSLRGKPNCLALHPSSVAIGMSLGHILLFDRSHCLQAVLHSTPPPPSRSLLNSALASSIGTRIDSVTCVRLSEGASLLLAGHASGRLVLWDTATGTVLKDCTDLHDAPIAHLRFLHPSRAHCLTVDSNGGAHLATFSRMLVAYTVTRHCLLDGAAGIVTAVELLTRFGAGPGPTNTEQSSKDGGGEGGGEAVVAMCTPRATFIIRVAPKVELLQRLIAPSAPSPLVPTLEQPAGSDAKPTLSPQLAWAFVPSAPTIGGLIVNDVDARSACTSCAMLAIAWGVQLQLLRLVGPEATSGGYIDAEQAGGGGETRLVSVHVQACRSPLCGIAWLDDGVLLLLDSEMVVHALDANLSLIEELALPTSPYYLAPCPVSPAGGGAEAATAQAATAQAAHNITKAPPSALQPMAIAAHAFLDRPPPLLYARNTFHGGISMFCPSL